MGLAARLDRFIPDLSSVVKRFPVPVAISLALWVYLNFISWGGTTGDFQVIAAGAVAFFAALSASLFAEGRKLPPLTGVMLGIGAAAVLGIVGYFTEVFSTHLLFLFGGLIPLLMISPFLHGAARQGALWLFNLRFGLAALLASVVGLLFALGLSAIVEALRVLFSLDPGGRPHEHIWLTALSLIGPLYGLSLLPRTLDEEVDIAVQKGSLLERGVSVLVNYILVPVILVYAAILHAYAVKILLDGGLPKGQIATMVSIFAVGGTAAWLVAWPWREQGTRLLRLFMRFWFFLLAIPATLLVIAIWRRLSDYGVTPDRYGIVLVAVWVAALTAYLAIRRNRADMRAILGGAGLLLLVGAVGPFGAYGLTIESQFVRLTSLLERNGILKDGAVTPPGKLLEGGAAGDGYSIVYALRDAGGLQRLAPWFAGDEKTPFTENATDWSIAQGVTERLGFAQSSAVYDGLSFTANAPAAISVPAAARMVGPMQAFQRYEGADPQKPMTALFDKTTLTIRLEAVTYEIPLADLMAKAKAKVSAKGAIQPAIALDFEQGITLVIDQLYANLNQSPPLGSMRFWLILPPQP